MGWRSVNVISPDAICCLFKAQKKWYNAWDVSTVPRDLPGRFVHSVLGIPQKRDVWWDDALW